MKYLFSLGRRLAISLLDGTKTFAEKETLAFGAFVTAIGTGIALKVAENFGITLSASQLALVTSVAGAAAVVIIREFVGSLNFVKIALEAQELAQSGVIDPSLKLPEPPAASVVDDAAPKG